MAFSRKCAVWNGEIMKPAKRSEKCQSIPSNICFSEVVEGIPEAMSIKFNQMVYDLKRAGRDVIVLSLGEAFFDIPLFDFRQIDFVKGYHYSDSLGIPDLREKIAAYYRRQYGAPVEGDSDLLISAGSKILIYMSMRVVLNASDEVLLHEPYWLSYPEQARLIGAVPKFIPYYVSPGDFERYISPSTRMVVLNNPNNPAGRVYSGEELWQLYTVCRRHGIYILIDEAYSDFVLDDSFVSLPTLVPDKDHIIVVNSLSKNMGMSGWRIGYVISHPDFIARLLKVNQHLITCAPTILQLYCARYFEKILEITLPQVGATVAKRNRVKAFLSEMDVKHLEGASTFYFLVGIDPYKGSSFEFASHLLKEKAVCVVPGSAYGKSTERFVRVSIGTEPEERVKEGLLLLKELTQEF